MMMPPSTPLNLWDYAKLARQRIEPPVWDFIEGGSEDESTLIANRAVFSQWGLRPRILEGIDQLDLSIELFGTRLTSPILVAPLGYQGLAHSEAEAETARGAGAAKSLMVVSTMSNCTLEEVAKAATGPLWFQLYIMKDRTLTLSLIRRAEAAGYLAIVVTVDAPIMGRRERDLRNNFSLPFHLRPRNLPFETDADLHRQNEGVSSVASHANSAFDRNLNWDTLSWLRKQTHLPIVLKGVLTREDTRRAIEINMNGVIVSNHGGRQLDGAVTSLDALPEVVEAAAGTGCQVLFDSGIRRGTDALKARALGAAAVLVGRPIIWGLLVHGAEGVRNVLGLLQGEIEQGMALTGQSHWSKIERSLVSPNPTLPTNHSIRISGMTS